MSTPTKCIKIELIYLITKVIVENPLKTVSLGSLNSIEI